MSKLYTLLDRHGQPYRSAEKGRLGGHAGTKVYGTLDCPVALSFLRRGFEPRHRVFFADEATAMAAGFRPCGACLRERYAAWKAGDAPLTAVRRRAGRPGPGPGRTGTG